METTITVQFTITDKDEENHTGQAQKLVAVIKQFAAKLAETTKVPHHVSVWTSDDRRPDEMLPRTYLDLGRIPTTADALAKWLDSELASLSMPYGIPELEQAFRAGWDRSTDNEQLIFALYNLLSAIVTEKMVHMPNVYRMEVHRRFRLIQEMLKTGVIKAAVIPDDARQAYELLAELFPHRSLKGPETYIVAIPRGRYRVIHSLIARLVLDRNKSKDTDTETDTDIDTDTST